MANIIDNRVEAVHENVTEDSPKAEKTPCLQTDSSELTSWQELDAKICRHPFLQTFSKEQRKSMQKGILLADIDETAYRQMRKQFIDFLADLLRIKALILKNIYKDFGNYEVETEESCHSDTFFKNVLENNDDYKRLPQRSKLRVQFDGVAYMTAVSNCISRYDADYINSETGCPASFLGLFKAEYQNCLNSIRAEYITGLIHIPKGKRSSLSKIIRYLQTQYPNYWNKALPDSIYQELSDIFDLPLKTTKELVSALRLSQTASLDAPVGESKTSVGSQVSDDCENSSFPTDMDWNNMQDHLDVYAVIQAISTLELKNYNRLLMNNQLLYPIHLETYSPHMENKNRLNNGSAEYKKALKDHHERLKRGVWDFPYLNFVGWKNERGNDGEAEDIQVLCDYYPVQPLLKETIAKYRKVTPANVSYYIKKFEVLRCQIKDMLCSQDKKTDS